MVLVFLQVLIDHLHKIGIPLNNQLQKKHKYYFLNQNTLIQIQYNVHLSI